MPVGKSAKPNPTRDPERMRGLAAHKTRMLEFAKTVLAAAERVGSPPPVKPPKDGNDD